jgi:DNA-binding IclR family transcriptional regulator
VLPDASTRVRALLAALDAEPGLTTAEAAERAGLPFRHAAVLLWRLEDAGAAVHEGHRWFPVVAPDD